MGTTYTIFAKGSLRVELDEMSSKFSIDLTGRTNPDREDSLTAGNAGTMTVDAVMGAPEVTANFNAACTRRVLTPEDLVQIAIEMVKVASYWRDAEELRKAASDHMKDFYTQDTLGAIFK